MVMYHAVMERGLVRTMACRDDLELVADPRPCPACEHGLGAWHWIAGCLWRHLFRLAVPTELQLRLETFCARWKRRAVWEWGVVVLYGQDAFVPSVGALGDDTPHPALRVRTIYLFVP